MSQMTALVLAAGYGSRIADITTDPKCLLKIKGKTLIEWHFLALKTAGVKKIIVVTGYKREMLEDFLTPLAKELECELSFAINDDYKIKGNTYSLFYGLEKVQGPFLLFDADLIYDPNILINFIKDEIKNQILVGEATLDDIECTKTLLDKNGFVRIMADKRAVTSEELEKFIFKGEAIGVLKFSDSYRSELLESCNKFLRDPKNISKNWEHVMNEFLFTHDMEIHKTLNEKWVEIDNKEDLEKATRLFE